MDVFTITVIIQPICDEATAVQLRKLRQRRKLAATLTRRCSYEHEVCPMHFDSLQYMSI